ncbi:hypothetical protein [Nocardia thailandica]|uniref:hypothetical protein n=1 Tax=Nocardia thailandica TaxID=257275 RepID=UPI0002E22A71|nr:hypothetical protein [Nocardia thailandica]
MLPWLPICALLLASAAVVVYRWRTFRPTGVNLAPDIDAARFTTAIATVIAATALGITDAGDEVIDPALARIGLGENISDLAQTVWLVLACAFFAGQSAVVIQERITDKNYDVRRLALIVCAVVAVLLIILSRLSESRTTPAASDFVFDDVAGRSYSLVFWCVIVVTALLVTTAASYSIIDLGPQSQLVAMCTAGASSALVAAYVLGRFAADHGGMADWLTRYGQYWTIPGLVGITVAGLLQGPGPAARRQARR